MYFREALVALERFLKPAVAPEGMRKAQQFRCTRRAIVAGRTRRWGAHDEQHGKPYQ